MNLEVDATFKHLHGMLTSILTQEVSPIRDMIKALMK